MSASRPSHLVRGYFFQGFGSQSSTRVCFSLRQGTTHAKDKVQQFLSKANTIDPRIIRQRVPELLLMLIEDESTEAGPMVNELLAKVRAASSTPSVRIFSLAIEAWLKSTSADATDEAWNLVQELFANDLILKDLHADEEDTLNCILAQVIHALLERVGRYDNTMRLVEKARMLEQQMLTMHADNVCQPNTTSMNARIALLGARRKSHDAQWLLETMIEAEDRGDRRIAPNHVSYNSVIHAFAKDGDHVKAESTLRRMISRFAEKRSDVQPSIVSFNALLNALSHSSRRGAAEDAERTLDMMEQVGRIEGLQISPDVYSYTAVIDAYSKSNTPDKAKNVFDRLIQRQLEGYNVVPTVVTFTAVFHALSRSRRLDAPQTAMQLLSFMEELHSKGTNVAPTTVVYNSLLTVWKRHADGPEAVKTVLQILKQMKTESASAKPNRRTYGIVLSALSNSRGEHTKVAYDLLDEMISSGDPEIVPDTLIYNTLLNTLIPDASKSTESKVQEIFSMLKKNSEIGRVDARASTRTYNVMMKRASRSFREDRAYVVNALLDEMEKSYRDGDPSLRPDAVSYTTCIGAWAVDHGPNSFGKAHEILERMKLAYTSGNAAARPNTITYKALLKGYRGMASSDVSDTSKDQIITAILQILEEMRETEEAKPDENAYVYVIDILRLLPRRDESLVATMKSVYDSYLKDFKAGIELRTFLLSKDPYLLQFLLSR